MGKADAQVSLDELETECRYAELGQYTVGVRDHKAVITVRRLTVRGGG